MVRSMKYRITQRQMAILNANFALLFLVACAQGGSTIRRPDDGDPAGGGDPGPTGAPADSLTLSNASGSIAEGMITVAHPLAVVSITGTDYTVTIDQADRFELQDNELRIKAGARYHGGLVKIRG